MNKNVRALAALLALGLALRIAGLLWGLPDATHFFSFHPDEFSTAGTVAGMLNTGELNPKFFQYGSLFLYLTYFASWPGHAAGAVGTVVETHFVARSVTIALGTGSILLVFLLGRSLYGRGVAAAALLALMPGHVLHSHFATVDVPATFFATSSLLLSARGLSRRDPRWCVAAGAAAGLAAATKYNVGIVLLSALASLWLTRERSVRPFLTVAAVALAAFVLAMPYAILDFDSFRDDVVYELLEHSREGHRNIFTETGNGWWYHLTANLPYLTGVPLMLVSLGGVALLVRRRRPADLVLLAFFVPYFVMLGFSQVRFLRYTIPLTPVLALAAVELVESWRSRRTARRLAYVLLLVSLAILTGRQVYAITREDPREAAGRWMQRAPGATVGVVTRPWHYTPPLVPWNGGLDSRSRFEAMNRAGEGPFRLVVCEGWDVRLLRQERPDFFVMSEFEWREEERLGDAKALAFLRALDESYRLVATFDTFPASQRWIFGGFAPHDWLYPYARVRIWQRR